MIVLLADNKEHLRHTVEPKLEEAARISYLSEERGEEARKKLLRRLVELGHESVFEHVTVSFIVHGLSRVASHQLVRHRFISVTQMSQRYVDQTDINFVVPPRISQNPDLLEKVEKWFAESKQLYQELRGQGVRKEDARFVLPQAIETSMFLTANLREWRHFLKLRLDKAAQWEIRKLAGEILKELSYIAPTIFEDIVEQYRSLD
jgi:thymidylate synthase (FAD)